MPNSLLLNSVRSEDNSVQYLLPTRSMETSKVSMSFDDALSDIDTADVSGNFFLSHIPITPRENPLKRLFFEGIPTLTSTEDKAFLDHKAIAHRQCPLGRKLDVIILEHAFLNLKQNQNIILSVNMSAKSIADPAWTKSFHSLAISNKNEARRLVVNFYEKTIFDIPEIVQVFLRDSCGSNIRFGICDFASGFCSLRNLKSLPIDIVIVDPILLQNSNLIGNGEALLKAISEFCRVLDFETVASGVNSEQAFVVAQRTGWEWLKGTYISSKVS